MSKQKMMTLSMLAAVVVLASLTLHTKAQAQAKDAERGQEGMVVVKDAQTGKMRAPTPEELRALRAKAPPPAASLSGTTSAPKNLTRRDGARGVRLGEKTLVYEVVTRGEDGTLSEQCVQGEDAAKDALQHPANAQHKEHKHEAR
jgi:hypothetical protein